MAGTQWEDTAIPILQQIFLWEDDETRPLNPDTEEMGRALDKSPAAICRQLESLHGEGYISMLDARAGGDVQYHYIDIELQGRGRRVIGEWPGEPAEEFLKKLDRLIASATDEDERTKLTKLKAAAKAVGLATVGGLVEAAAQGAI